MLNRFPAREAWKPLVATTGIERHPAHRGFEADDAAKCRGNPWHLGCTSGGSSGGAAAAIAAGCGPLAIATDGVGSIRVPCSFCGVFGLQPTYGLGARSPWLLPASWPSLAHTGLIARTVADAALLLGVIAGHDRRDPGSLPLERRSFAARVGR